MEIMCIDCIINNTILPWVLFLYSAILLEIQWGLVNWFSIHWYWSLIFNVEQYYFHHINRVNSLLVFSNFFYIYHFSFAFFVIFLTIIRPLGILIQFSWLQCSHNTLTVKKKKNTKIQWWWRWKLYKYS